MSDNQATGTDVMAIEVQGLSRRFGRHLALDDVSLKVPVGGVFGLVGLNGAGKTTLIKHLIGSLRPHVGNVRIFGTSPIEDPVTVLGRIGYLTEEDSLPRWLTVRQLFEFGRSVYPTWDDEYAASLCERFQLRPNEPLGTLSKGVRARAGLLAAIAHHPDLLILDEPSSGLDPIARRDILEAIISGISDQGRTVLFSSHLLDEVARVCETVGVMSNGQLLPPETLDTIQSQYSEWIIQSNVRPVISKALDTQGDGAEWSIVGPASMSEQADFPSDRVIEHRPMTLDRYFSARVHRSSDEQTEQALEVAS
ncbi:ABC transporter ATP-binding protein [Roseimaritima ulvae]|uniref:ABC transporter ATP-binding protein YtrB n=1 Tax=Roseimaritima ulvae TaxID=980254 RepID=A0A5B9QX70_9BACT|nr:ABC transporter ATP-binding protein [Roseimaritima ulvae]QEG41716.1 ABC transporter ATP-binding protein YtrB [Roseimaritima ulvae]